MPMTAGQGFTRALKQAEPLPLPAEISDWGWKIRPGQLCMIAGPPGQGKSMFTLWMLDRVGLPTLYGSADMDPFDASVRLAAMRSGDTQESIEKAMLTSGREYYADVLSDTSVEFFFDSSPTLGDVAEELDAYVELNDEWPKVIVIDNLVNLQTSEDWAGQMLLLSDLHSLARTTGAAVIVLHHAKETDKKDITKPPSRKGIHMQVTQYPELVLTVALDQENGIFRVACVKQRGGKSDATGDTFNELSTDMARCSYSPKRSDAVNSWWDGVE